MGITRYELPMYCYEDLRVPTVPMVEDSAGTYVLFSDHIDRERVLVEALEKAKDFIEDLQLTDAEWEYTLDAIVIALAKVRQQ